MKNLEDTGIKKIIKLIKSKFESLAKVATSGSYTDLSNKPTVPTKVSELTNDKNFITASDNVATATKLKNARKIALSGGATGTATSFDGSTNITIPVTNISPDYMGMGYLSTHPENNGVIIPFINNDIAYLTKRGGSVVVKYDDVVQNIDISAVFDGSASYWGDSTLGTKAETVTIELTLHRTFRYGNTIYIDNGKITWHAKDMTVEVMNTNYADDVWTTKGSVSNYDKSQYYIAVSHTPVGASNTGGGFNKVRLTFSNFKSNSFRIAAIGVIGYNSAGLRETFLPKDGGSVYGNILPYADNSYNLGSSSNKWANVYATKFTGALTGNADTATKLATARTIRTNLASTSTASFDGSADVTPGVTGTLPVANGGTGQTSANAAANAFINSLTPGSAAPQDGDYFISQNVGGGTTTTTYHRRPFLALWSYIKSKADSLYSVIGHTHNAATTSSSGFLSSTDKSKLDGIAAGAQVNQKAFSQFKVGTTEIKADTETDILTLVAGSNVTLTPDATNDQITITAKDTTYTSLPNPKGLRVQVNGDGASEVRYDGSVAKTINIKAGSNVTITSDSSGNITISSTTSATGDVGTVVYEASSGGLYCDGNTANTTANSKAIEDSSFKYKRLRFYCQGYYGLICTDMPLDRECEAYATGNDRGKRYGGVIFPTAENGNIDSTGIGPSSHMYYELKWRVEKEAAGWRVRVVDSGWLGFNAGITSNANYTGNSSAAVAGTNYISWNQRHNNGYCIYKIVAYTD